MKVLHESDAPTIIATGADTPEVTGRIVLRRLIDRAAGADRFVLLQAEYAPDSTAQMHGHDFEHEIYVLDGSLTITTTGTTPGEITTTALRRGDAVFIPRGEIHGFATGPDQTARLMIAVPAEAMDGHHQLA